MILHTFWRSTAAYRVRIALHPAFAAAAPLAQRDAEPDNDPG